MGEGEGMGEQRLWKRASLTVSFLQPAQRSRGNCLSYLSHEVDMSKIRNIVRAARC
jgi:hypothetical protein